MTLDVKRVERSLAALPLAFKVYRDLNRGPPRYLAALYLAELHTSFGKFASGSY